MTGPKVETVPDTATGLAASIIEKANHTLAPATATGIAASMTANPSIPPATATGVAGFGVGGFGVGTFGGGGEGPAFGFAEAVEIDLTGAEARAEAGALSPAVEVGLTGVEAQALSEVGALSQVAALPDIGADALRDATGRPFILGTSSMVEENDTLEARATIRPSTGTATAGAVVNGVGASVDVGATFDAVILPAIWHSQGVDLFLQIDRASQELEAVRLMLLGLSDRPDDLRGHNNPPGLLGAPDIDLETIEAAIQCLAVLRLVIIQPKPDFEIVALLWRVVLAALKAMSRLATWAARTTKILFDSFLSTTLGKSFAKGLGTTMGASVAAGIVYEITQHGPDGLQAVGQVLKGVMAALGGHPG